MSAIDAIFSIFDTLGLILMYGWPFILLLILFILKLRMKSWTLEAIIIEKRGENLIKTNDRARKFTDESGLVKYQLLKCKDTFPVYNYDWIMHNVYVPTTLSEKVVNLLRGNVGTLFLFRYGSKQYKPMSLDEKTGNFEQLAEIKGKDGQTIYESKYIPFDPRDKLGAIDLEVLDWDNMNFMVQEQRASIERRKNKMDKLMQIIIPAVVLAVVAMVSIFMLYYANEAATRMATTAPVKQPATVPEIPIISGVVPGQ